MQQHNQYQVLDNISNKIRDEIPYDQVLYNLLFTGRITLKEYLSEIKRAA